MIKPRIIKTGWRGNLVEKAQQDPVWWIKNVLGEQLWSKQEQICRAVVENERTAVPASFGVGKTFLAARLTLWFLYNFRPAKVITTAPTGRQVKDLLWSEIRTSHSKSKMKLGGTPLLLSLSIHEDQFAVGFSTDDTNMDMFTGYHAPNQLVVFDQAGGIPDMVWKAAEGLMTSENCKWLAIGNTAISEGAFADICMPERKSGYGDWKIIPITAEESPNVVAKRNQYPGLVSYDWVEKRKKQWGTEDPLYKIFVKAQFVPSVQMVVVPYQFIEKAKEIEGEDDEEFFDVGLDVARTGLDSTVWFVRSGSKVLDIRRTTGNDTMTVAGMTIEYVRQWEYKFNKRCRVIKVDVIGIGAGVYDKLAEEDLPVLPINNAEVQSVVDRERFSNVRAEMAWALRYRFEHGHIGLKNLEKLDPDLTEMFLRDLQAQHYDITSAGKIQLWPKEKIKQLIGRSPDYWDAGVMAFEEPGGGPPALEFLGGSANPVKVEEKILSDREWKVMLGEIVDVDDPSFHRISL